MIMHLARKTKRQLYTLAKHVDLLGTVVFVNGALIMVIELVGARILTPYVGSSSYVWTAVIGTMMAALSLGYAYGGRYADTTTSVHALAKILFACAIGLSIGLLLQGPVLGSLGSIGNDVRLQAVAASLLFAPATFFGGMVSPYIAKTKTKNNKKMGTSIGAVYSIGTAGSIFGTFLSGFWLTGSFGNRTILFFCVAIYAVMALITGYKTKKGLFVLAGYLFYVMIAAQQTANPLFKDAVYQTDTQYGHYGVYETLYNGTKARLLATDKFSIQTGVVVGDPATPAFDYIKRFKEVAQTKKSAKRILLLGGGTYSMAAILRSDAPQAQIDIVEIDPALTTIAKNYFYYTEHPLTTVYSEDARTYINRQHEPYDIIFVDVYNSLHPPFHVMTKEAVQRMKTVLATDGIIAVNTVGSLTGKNSQFTSAVVSTYKSVMPSVRLNQAVKDTVGYAVQNLIVTAVNNDTHQPFATNISPAADNQDLVFTDDFAPTEKLLKGY